MPLKSSVFAKIWNDEQKSKCFHVFFNKWLLYMGHIVNDLVQKRREGWNLKCSGELVCRSFANLNGGVSKIVIFVLYIDREKK